MRPSTDPGPRRDAPEADDRHLRRDRCIAVTASAPRSPRLVTVIVAELSSELRRPPLRARAHDIAHRRHELDERLAIDVADRRRDQPPPRNETAQPIWMPSPGMNSPSTNVPFSCGACAKRQRGTPSGGATAGSRRSCRRLLGVEDSSHARARARSSVSLK